MEKLSIVVPCFNEEKSLPYLYNEIVKVRKNMDYITFEIIFVNDGSTDKTLDVIKEFAKIDNQIRYISFSRNFGKEAAMLAGFRKSSGDYIASMDADLQDPPELLEEMLKFIKEDGYDSVATCRKTRRGEPFIKSIFSILYYKIIRKMTKLDIVDGARNYRLMTRQMLESVLELSEYNRYLNGIYAFVGFNTKWIDYDNKKRIAGKTKYSLLTCFNYGIEGITSFSAFPLKLASILGIIFCIFSFLFIIFIIGKTLIYGDTTSGWPSLVCIIVFLAGIQLFFLGIIGEYLSKTYLETKNRPLYVIKETNIEQ